MKHTATCSICKGQFEIEIESMGDPEMDTHMKRMASTLPHQKCADALAAKEADDAAQRNAVVRSMEWNRLCPAMYLTSENWVLSDSGKKKLHQKPVTAALAWQYGVKGIILYGSDSGTGKTTCAWVLAAREFKTGKFVVAMTHSEMTNSAIKVAKGEAPKKWVSLLKKCDLLMIDDLGKSKFKGVDGEGKAGEELLFDVIDSRCRSELPTIITSNLTGEGMKGAMSDDRGEPFVRRLREFFVHVCFNSEKKP